MKLIFEPITGKEGVLLKGEDPFTPSLGYGFITEEIKTQDRLLNDAEITTGFVGEQTKQEKYFRMQFPERSEQSLPKGRNYTVEVTLTGENVTLFAKRRRCIFKNQSSKRFSCKNKSTEEKIQATFSVHVGSIIPDHGVCKIEDRAIDLFFLGNQIEVETIKIMQEEKGKTFFLAGDSTVTDQRADLPYDPYNCYCGWGQMLPLFMKEGLSLCNQAHSGLTTESFRAGGHYKLIEEMVRDGDFVAFQFGHNDQKIDKLGARGGYAKNIRRYIDEVRELGAKPLLVTSIARNTWNGHQGAYHDMLEAYANVCREIAQEKNIPLLDLHQRSKDFILEKGMQESTRYFHPGDWTHTNDYGGRQMANFIVEEILKLEEDQTFEEYKEFVTFFKQPWIDEEEAEAIKNLPIAEKDALEDKLKGWEKENAWLRR